MHAKRFFVFSSPKTKDQDTIAFRAVFQDLGFLFSHVKVSPEVGTRRPVCTTASYVRTPTFPFEMQPKGWTTREPR